MGVWESVREKDHGLIGLNSVGLGWIEAAGLGRAVRFSQANCMVLGPTCGGGFGFSWSLFEK
jgi:hypothetical protein